MLIIFVYVFQELFPSFFPLDSTSRSTISKDNKLTRLHWSYLNFNQKKIFIACLLVLALVA